jgi:hypothetical protein
MDIPVANVCALQISPIYVFTTPTVEFMRPQHVRKTIAQVYVGDNPNSWQKMAVPSNKIE